MKILVDTDVWSEALRKKQGAPSRHVQELSKLVQEFRVQLIGPIRMEILSGIREANRFTLLKNKLSAFDDRELSSGIFILAASLYNTLRSKGVQGSNTDFIICACSIEWDLPILTKDKDFERYSKYIPIELHKAR